jgi:ADP-heptose:LPS heptosyltransferase
MRNEGPEFDLDYYEFKNTAPCKIAFWELNYAEIQNRESHNLLVEDILTMLKQQGIKVNDYNPHWLGHYLASQGYPKESDFTVGFYTGASQNNKRWTKDNWMQLGDLILDNSNCKIEIYSGLSDDEVQLSTEIAFVLQNRHSIDRCCMVAETKIFELAHRFYKFDLLISNDTFATHLGSALGIPVIGIYFSTDSSIWGGNSKYFVPVQSRLALNCPMRKHHAGNCRLYYDECLSQCKNHDDIAAERVWDVIRNNSFIEYNS